MRKRLFSKILVAIDGSESAKKAFTTSIYLASISKCKIDVIHVVSCEFGGDSAASLELVEDLKTKANSMLEEYKKDALEKDVLPKFMIEIGDPANMITEIVNSEDYDLVVLGTRGMSTFKELFLGSVSMKVIHHAKCPVMVVR
ncbi:MAG: universal stress protein UspA [Nitrosopumilales archaeon CG15_BIG_FIL_POST_REV_8_21_14_020_33_23]|nr:MAG: universal stress protein UspA [Nitrosopumilales archaeon CG11_big_fil_rev_8_21_14_0_20_33_24]PIW35483.1 MAG: universal stress protein UspA [Nitrosopumilales archaeon CG15_BIG_FIL_POST_REV_8_21_14_020_33_23]PJB98586.1 MAG: universal stress protein UspA [Nitrosopumilales archaeon CG_4_9_14_0_8_um_filter_34_10]